MFFIKFSTFSFLSCYPNSKKTYFSSFLTVWILLIVKNKKYYSKIIFIYKQCHVRPNFKAFFFSILYLQFCIQAVILGGKRKILGGENGDFGRICSCCFFYGIFFFFFFWNLGSIIYMNLYIGLVNLDLDLEYWI